MPPEARKATSRSAVLARAKMLFAAHLAWLEGFPLAVESGSVRWLAVPPHTAAHELSIERDHLRRATYAVKKLWGDEAPGLQRLAGDPEVWLGSVERRLEMLKGAIHHGAPLPPDLFQEPSLPRGLRERAARLAADEPSLRPLVRALSWVQAGHPERVRTGLDVVAGWSQGSELLIRRLGEQSAVCVLLRLLELAARHGERAQALATCLFDERIHDLSLSEGRAFCFQILHGIGRRAKAPLPEELPKGTLGAELADWCEEIALQSHRSRLHALRLFEVATPLPLAERWALWWHSMRQLWDEARKLRSRPYDRDRCRDLRARLERHEKTAPPPLAAGALVAALRQETAEPAPGHANLLLRALALVPAEASAPGRLECLLYWSFLADEGIAPVPLLLAGFERYLNRTLNRTLSRTPVETAALLAPWKDIAAVPRRMYSTVEWEITLGEERRSTVLAAYDHLAAVVARVGGLEPEPAVRAVELFLLAGDSNLALGLFESLRAGGNLKNWYTPGATRAALRLCRDSPESFSDLLKALSAQEEQAGLSWGEWPETVLGTLSTGAIGGFVREAVVTRQLARLIHCGNKSVLLQAAGVEPLPHPSLGDADGAVPAWVERYPPPLHPPLQRLAAVLDEAEPKAARWLADDFPDARRLEEEIQGIEQRLGAAEPARQTALRIRLANLRERLAQVYSSSATSISAPGAARLERLRAKLDHAWGRAVFDRWESDLDAHLAGALRRLLALDDLAELPPWLTEEGTLALLAAATRLPLGSRRLAYRLFRLRCGPPPWDLRDAPQNQSFVASLPWIEWAPWIDGIGSCEARTDDGRRIHLALEDDPLEIFRMGAYFQTCLSPGAVNYFSVFANAADINKRVLYARDGNGRDGRDGRVFGRCLLALTAAGGLLQFHAYCHDGAAGFERICADFAGQLAARMRTQCISRAPVPSLVAPGWYDDGALDLGQSYKPLEDGSPLRRKLAAARPSEVLGELRRGLKPARLSGATLPLIVALPELRERPELVVPLLPLVADCLPLPEPTLALAAHLGLQAGAVDLVRRLFAKPLADSLREIFRDGYWVDPRIPEALVRVDPVRLLAVLRQTRGRTAPDWTDETNGDRLASAAAALDALHRPRQALALWRRMVEDPDVRVNFDHLERARAVLREREPTQSGF